MLQTRLCKEETNSEYLVITLRKLIAKKESLHNCKVSISLNIFEDQQKNSATKHVKNSYRNSQARPIKNGVAYFYGESIVIAERVKAFNIVVQLVEDENVPEKAVRRQLAKIEIGEEEISEMSRKKCSFSSGSEIMELIWEAKFQHERIDRPEEYQDRSLDDDFNDIQENKPDSIERLMIGRKMYSPAIRGEIRRPQRSSSRRKKDDSRFDLVSQSPHKKTMDTNETLISLKKRIKLMSPSKNKNESFGLKEFKREMHQSKVLEKVKQKEIEKKQLEIKIQRVNMNSELPNASPQKTRRDYQKFETTIKSPLTPQHNSKNSILIPKKKTQKFYERISLKSLLYTSVIGIISGVAASQF